MIRSAGSTSRTSRGLRTLAHSFITLQPAPGRARRAVRWTAAVAAGLLVTSLILGPARGALGLLGAMAVGAGREAPFRRRLRQGVGVGLATIGCQAIGLLIAPYPWLVPPVMAALTFAVVWAWHGLQIGPPGPINTVFAGAFGSYMGTRGYGFDLLGVTTLAWFSAMLASLAILALRPHEAEEEAVAAAESAVGAFCEAVTIPDAAAPLPAGALPSAGAAEMADAAPSVPAQGQARAGMDPAREAILRSRAWRAVETAWHTLRTGRTPGTVPVSEAGRVLDVRLRAAHLRLLRALHAQSFPADGVDIAQHFDLVPLGFPSWRYLLRTAATLGSRPTLVAGRAAAAVLLGASVAFVSPVGHPYWAILSALIILHMGPSRADLTIRAAHRVVGTSVGVLAYFALVSLHPSAWLRIGIVVLAIYGLEALVTRNYALAVVFVTIFALLMTPVASESQVMVLMRDRVVETIIGASSAALITWLGSREAPVLLVRRQYRLTLESLVTCLADVAAGRRDETQSESARALLRPGALDPVREHRRNLVFELGRAGALQAGQRPDAPGALAPWTDLQREVSLFGYDVVAAGWRERGAGAQAAAVACANLQSLIASLPPISKRNIDPAPIARTVRETRAAFLAAA